MSVLYSPATSNEYVTHHGLITVLLKLYESDSRDVVHVHVSVVRLEVVSAVEEGQHGWRRHPHSVLAVYLVGHDIVRLQ